MKIIIVTQGLFEIIGLFSFLIGFFIEFFLRNPYIKLIHYITIKIIFWGYFIRSIRHP